MNEVNTLNIWTWNINSVRNKVSAVNQLLIKHDIDILLLTETKINVKHESTIVFDNHYKWIWHSNQKSYYHGVVFIYKKHLNVTLLTKILPETTDVAFVDNLHKNTIVIKKYKDQINNEVLKAHQTEGRLLSILCDDIVIVGTYVPNSGVDRKEPLKRLAYRTLKWDHDLIAYLLTLQEEYKKVIWLGDLNVTMYDNDVLNINANIAGTTKQERDNINHFLKHNEWVDTWHHCHLDILKCQERSTWGVYTRFPMRLDYVVCSPSLQSMLISSERDDTFKESDHIPIGSTFKL